MDGKSIKITLLLGKGGIQLPFRALVGDSRIKQYDSSLVLTIFKIKLPLLCL